MRVYLSKEALDHLQVLFPKVLVLEIASFLDFKVFDVETLIRSLSKIEKQIVFIVLEGDEIQAAPCDFLTCDATQALCINYHKDEWNNYRSPLVHYSLPPLPTYKEFLSFLRAFVLDFQVDEASPVHIVRWSQLPGWHGQYQMIYDVEEVPYKVILRLCQKQP